MRLIGRGLEGFFFAKHFMRMNWCVAGMCDYCYQSGRGCQHVCVEPHLCRATKGHACASASPHRQPCLWLRLLLCVCVSALCLCTHISRSAAAGLNHGHHQSTPRCQHLEPDPGLETSSPCLNTLGPLCVLARALCCCRFDFLITLASFAEMVVELQPGPQEARFNGGLTAIRLLRLFRLARYWDGLHHILSILGHALSAGIYLLGLVLLFMFIMGLLGMQVRCARAPEHAFAPACFRWRASSCVTSWTLQRRGL